MLTVTKINALKPKDKPYKVADSSGLYIDVRPTGSKFWRQKYRFNGKEKLLSHGKYPEISLAEARQFRDIAIKQIKQHIDPAKEKRRLKDQTSNTLLFLSQGMA